MTVPRLCSKTPCGRPAVATLTYVYADSQIVLGALATHAEPHSYDLCADHARRLTAPRGWEVVRLVPEFAEPEAAPDELVAIAEAVRRPRQTARPADDPADPPATARRTVVASREVSPAARELSARVQRPVGEVSAVEVGRRGHLRVLRDADTAAGSDAGSDADTDPGTGAEPRTEAETRTETRTATRTAPDAPPRQGAVADESR
ncbi:DUF3499 domain-containing protein [Arsenicicoccus sp. oral taxon 190]|uniref:DUF3499 domain-containing protein n=1 Tax=Arsenicicoccus sp. oral taxon 190 TaxID=1658671 RepID=UPI0009E2B44E|nr:DUF3499 domain-containing protein [Arsenicicoccus sp. oral taxon 190]